MTNNLNVFKSQSHPFPQDKRVLLAQLLREKASNAKSWHPLSYGQQALWFLYQSAPKSAAYNTAFPVRIRSKVVVPALLSAFQKLIDRHAALRTTFPTQGGKPIQEICGYQQVCFEEIDASAWNWDELTRRVVEAYQRPFDLEQGPVLRVSLFTCSEQDHVLLLTIHHIASDGWSLWMLLEELRVLYLAQKTGTQASLPSLALSYADYVDWQAERVAGSDGEKLLSYWQQQLAGELPVLNLPTDRPRPPVQTYHGDSHPFKLNEKLTQRLKEMAKAEAATLYETLLAAFQALLYRYTGQEDILVGSPFGRNQGKFTGIVGYFVNPVVLRAHFADNPTFKAFLSQVRETVSAARTHQNYPFPLLVEQLQPNRDPSRSPLFQVLFVLQQPQSRELADLVTPSETGARVDWGGLELEFFPMPTEEGQFDLTLEMVEAKKSLFGFFKYNTDLFDAATITRMVGHFETLLEAIVVAPEQPISKLPLLTANERQQLEEWNKTQVDYLQEACIHQLFESQVERTPDAVAVIFEQEHLTYRELNCRANQLAHYLINLGVKSEVLVGICVERSLDMLVGLLGILKAGGAYVPLDPAYPQERLAFMLEDAQVPVLLTQQQLVEKLPNRGSQVVCLDRDREAIAGQREENPNSEVTPNNLAYTIYTSGSTGKPKGVQIPHCAVVNLLNSMEQQPGLTNQDVLLSVTTLSFDIAALELFLPISVGARLILTSREVASDGTQLLEKLASSGATAMQATPATWRLLLEAGWQGSNRLKILCGGEALPRELVNQLLHRSASLWNLYGPTETTIWSLVYKVESEECLVSIGKPIANTQIYLLDSHLQPVPVGVPGELHIGGVGLARCYLNRPELTAEKFIFHSFSNQPGVRLYKTGDLARYLADGNIEFLGRIDHQVKVRGFRIELGEIEALLVQHPAVRQATVIAREDIPGDRRLVAYVVPNQELVPTSSELRYSLIKQLPSYMVPSAIVMLDTLPLTPNGKIDRRALPTPDTSSIKEASFAPPRDSLEQQLAQIWEEVLDVRFVGIRDNFFDLGGYSLLAVRLMARIQQQFGENMPLATLFQSPTIEQLADILRQKTDSLSWSPLVAIQPGGSKPPFFCFPGAGGNIIYLKDLARHLGADQPFYSLQAVGLDGELEPYTRVEDIAADYMKALQSVQPQGPYFLGGHSVGALVAFEVAQKLQKQGHEVALVAILDTEAPVPGRNLLGVDWDNAKWLTRIASLIERFLGKNLEISYEALHPLEPDEQLNYIGERLKTIDILPPEAGSKQVRGLVQVFKAHYQAYAHYMPQEVYPTRITLFQSSEVHSEDTASEDPSKILQEPTWGWNQFSVEPVDIHVVPGDHITMMAEPHVQVLAKRLRVYLEQTPNLLGISSRPKSI